MKKQLDHKNIIKETLCKSEVYKEKLQNKEWDKCWTLEYAEVNGIGFNIDIVPGVAEADDRMPMPVISAHQYGERKCCCPDGNWPEP